MFDYQGVSRMLTFVVSLLVTYSLYDQAWKIWCTKSVKDFTASIIVALVANELVWLNYGCSISEWPIITIGLINVPAAVWIVVGYIRTTCSIRQSPMPCPIPRTPGISRIEVISTVGDQEEIWRFYKGVFAPLEENTPLAQTWGRESFFSWMENPRVVKFVAYDTEGVVAFAAATNEISIDEMLSPSFFEKHYQGREVWNFPVIAIRQDKRGMALVSELIHAMMAEVPPSGVGVLTHSQNFNPLIPKLALKGCGGRVVGNTFDAEACFIMERKRE